MNKLQEIPFAKWHLLHVELQPHEKANLPLEAFGNLATSPSAAVWSYLYKGHVYGFYGYQWMRPGVLEIFIVPSIYVLEYPRQLYEIAKHHFEVAKRLPNLHRMQTFSWDHPVRNRFMERFGFTCEGVCRQYTSDKQDYRMWSFIIGG